MYSFILKLQTFLFSIQNHIICSLCTKPNINLQYSEPCIQITKNNLVNKDNLESIINEYFKNQYTACAKFSYVNENIIDYKSNIK